ncbi:MAG: VWA domain-containing protein [Pseudomonadota bacterium]
MKRSVLTSSVIAGLAAGALNAASINTLSAATSEQPQVMVIMDSSGSMKRKIGARTKMEIAKQAVTDFVASVPTDLPVGLMAYGHRRAKDCTDIQVMIPPAAGAAKQIEDSVWAMAPKGETPIAESLRAAADYMNSQTKTATVVLVTDGEEACNADPCAAATELEKSGVDFTAHVIGFGLSEEQSKAVKCLADNTGGQFIAANNSDELAGALVKTVVREPAPEPIKVASSRTVWFDDFDGNKLGEEWTVENPNLDAYIVDGGNLLTINANKHNGPKAVDAPNRFKAGIDLPSGDWDLTVTGVFEYSTGRDGFYLGLSDEEGNAIFTEFLSYKNSCGYTPYLYLRRYTAFKEVAKGGGKFAAKCGGRYGDYAKVAASQGSKPVTLTFSKRGRKYFGKVDSGPFGEVYETQTMTLLRAPSTVTMGAWKYGNGPGDTVVNVDAIKLETVN